MQLVDKVEELSRRLRQAEDRLALIEIEGAYSRAFDGRQGRQWAELFTEEGSYETHRAGPGGVVVDGPYLGRSALADMCNSFPLDCIHLMHMPQLTIHDDRASGRVHFTVYTMGSQSPRSVVANLIGYYDVDYSRTVDGWRIARRVSRFFIENRNGGAAYEASTILDQS